MKTRNYDIFVAKIYDFALIISFWGFPRLIDSPTSYATLIVNVVHGVIVVNDSQCSEISWGEIKLRGGEGTFNSTMHLIKYENVLDAKKWHTINVKKKRWPRIGPRWAWRWNLGANLWESSTLTTQQSGRNKGGESIFFFAKIGQSYEIFWSSSSDLFCGISKSLDLVGSLKSQFR